MPSGRIEDPAALQSVQSCLGRSLKRLHRSLEQTRRHETHIENLFAAWQVKWSDRRAQISCRLEQIEAHLDALAQQNEPKPRLSIVGESTTADGDVNSLGPF